MSAQDFRLESSKIAEQEQIEKDNQDRIKTLERIDKLLDEIEDRCYVTVDVPQRGVISFMHGDKEVVITKQSLKDNLYLSMMNAEENEEYLRNVPHERMEDVAIVTRYPITENASFVMTNTLCQHFFLTSSEVMEMAHENIRKQEFTCTNIVDVLTELAERQGMPQDYVGDMSEIQRTACPMYVLTNQRNIDGSVAMLSSETMENVHQKMGEDFYILPSSRHEVILLPKSHVENVKDLEEMVREVNRREVRDVDKLSDHVYQYQGKGRSISMVDSSVLSNTKSFSPSITKSHGKLH